MPVPRARLGGLFGGPSQLQRNELQLTPIIDAALRGITSSVQAAFLRKRQKNQDAIAEQQRIAQADQVAADRAGQAEDRALRLRTFEAQRDDRRQVQDQQAAIRARRVAAFMAKNPTATPQEAEAVADNDALFNAAMVPKPPTAGQRITDPVRGDVFNIDTGGVATPVTTPDGKPFRLGVRPSATPRPASERPATEAQRKAGAFLLMAEDANVVLDAMEKSGKSVPTLGEKLGAAVGRDVGNFLTSDEYRRMQAAGFALSDAWLRYTSGAAVPEQEVKRFAQSFLPVPGDDPTVLADKKRRRHNIVTALRQGVGKPGDVDTQAESALETIMRTYNLERGK